MRVAISLVCIGSMEGEHGAGFVVKSEVRSRSDIWLIPPGSEAAATFWHSILAKVPGNVIEQTLNSCKANQGKQVFLSVLALDFDQFSRAHRAFRVPSAALPPEW